MSDSPWFIAAILLVVTTLAGIVFRALTSPVGVQAWFLYQVTRLYCPLMFRWTSEGECTIPGEGPAIIVANHTSPVDPTLLWMNHAKPHGQRNIRVIGFVMAREFYDTGGIVGWTCRVMESIPAERDGRDIQAVRTALRRLQDGKLLGLFPEGRLNVDSPGTKLLKPAGTGVAWLAIHSKAPVIPVFIQNAPRGGSILRSFFKRSRTKIIYGQPVDLSSYYDRKLSSEELEAATDLIMKSVAELGGIEFTPAAEAIDLPETQESLTA